MYYKVLKEKRRPEGRRLTLLGEAFARLFRCHDGLACIGPADHAFRVELHIVDPGQFRQREPVRRRPMSGVAEADDWCPVPVNSRFFQGSENACAIGRQDRATEPCLMHEAHSAAECPGPPGCLVPRETLEEVLRTGIDELLLPQRLRPSQ